MLKVVSHFFKVNNLSEATHQKMVQIVDNILTTL